jgi:hypothetical protein
MPRFGYWRREEMEKWHAFVAYNSMTQYGFGTTSEADRYSEFLNREREVNHYYHRDLTADEFERLDNNGYDYGFRLDEQLDSIARLLHLHY